MAETTDWSRPDDVEAVRRSLLDWYGAARRDLPWRETTDAYPILVSEVMSQQTQLERVVEPWAAFLDRWPTVESLAAADRADVVGFWSDHRLGYNNRARYLHDAARQVVDEHGGEFPRTPDGLRELPGVGPYTAGAVASFAFEADVAVVDTNVRRVLHRAFDVPDDEGAFERAANALLPAGRSREWNNAMMELGARACGKRPSCEEVPCPWRGRCLAYRTGDFTAPDVPTQPDFEGSRRQFRGRVVRTLGAHGELPLDDLGPRVRVDYAPEGGGSEPAPDGRDSDGGADDSGDGGAVGRAWLRGLVEDLADDGLVAVVERDGEVWVDLAE